MKCLFLICLALCVSVVAGKMVAEQGKTRPVMKIIRLLQDMKVQLEKEAADDQDVYEKLTCWCKSNDGEKSQAVDEAQTKIEGLEGLIQELKSKEASLTGKINKVAKEIDANYASLKKAEDLRREERSKMSDSENEQLEAIKAVEGAVTALEKHNAGLIQQKLRVFERKPQLYSEILNNNDQDTFRAFLATKNVGAFLAIPQHSSYSSQSGQIFGILKQMEEDMKKNLGEAQKEEQEARAQFADMRKAKQAELAAARKQKADYESEFGETVEKRSNAEQELSDTEEQLDTDTKFLINLRRQCKQTDAEFQLRTNSRNEEIVAVGDTINILNSDDTFDQMNKTTQNFEEGPEFFQMSSHTRRMSKQERAARLLSKQSDPRIAALAVSVKLDAFVKVKKAIDGMITQLGAESRDEIAHRDFCIKEFDDNTGKTNQKQRESDDLDAKIAQLTATSQSLKEEIAKLNAEIAEMKKQTTRASDNRAKENADFQQIVADQRITQEILNKAIARMQQKYVFVQGAPHMQLSGDGKSDPGMGPARFNRYDVNKGGNKVVAMLTTVLKDSKQTEEEAVRDEQDAQKEYEGFVKDSNASIISKQKSVVNKTAAKAKTDEDNINAQADHKSAQTALTQLNEFKQGLHESCDFVLKNFDVRQKAREEEVQSLKEAKNILSGMK